MERKTYVDSDGLLHCTICKEPVEAIVDMPSFDGTGGTYKKKVRIMCKCAREEQRQKEIDNDFRRKQEAVKKLNDASLIDARLKNATFGNYKITESNERAFKICKKYAENFDTMFASGQGLLLYGEVGTGKSYTAAAIANELIGNMTPVVMTSFIKFINDTKSYFADDDSYLRRFDLAKLLIIDDFGAERSTDYALERVYSLVDSRYRSGKPLIVTTNIGFEEMKQCTDQRYVRIYDRIFSMCYPIKMSGTSWRKREAVERFESMNKLLGE